MMSEPEDIKKTTFILFIKNVVANWYNWNFAMPLKNHSLYLKPPVVPHSD